MSEADPPVLVEIDGAISWLRLNRPRSLNALSLEVLEGLDAALDRIEHDETTRVVVLTGSGRAFSAGADLKGVSHEDGTVDLAGFRTFISLATAVIERVARLDKAVIAAVNGIAVAGGFELVMACDLVLSAADAKFGDAHANFGLLPGAGGATRLTRLVGPMVAKQLMFTGQFISPTELHLHGVVSEIVPAERLEERVREVASVIAAKSPLVVARMKHLINDSLDQPVGVSIRAERLALEAHVHSEDICEGLSAFREKREPRYRGR
jgi:enoyl-CoA hydratase